MAQVKTQDYQAEAPRALVLEAGAEITALGVVTIIVCAISRVQIGESGLVLGIVIYSVIGILILRGLRKHCPHSHFGLANAITLVRAVFSSFLFALFADSLTGQAPLADSTLHWLITCLAAASLAFDGLDGWIARHFRMESRFGAQFDMHTDALFVLSLTLLLIVSELVGPWVIISGLMFYLFQAAKHVWPVLGGSLPPRWRRKTVCVLNTALLIIAFAPMTPYWLAQLACLCGLSLLIWSFGTDVLWLLSRSNQVNSAKRKRTPTMSRNRPKAISSLRLGRP